MPLALEKSRFLASAGRSKSSTTVPEAPERSKNIFRGHFSEKVWSLKKIGSFGENITKLGVKRVILGAYYDM